MGKSHCDMAHDFYYLGVDTGKSTRCQSPRVTYDGCDAYSYSTLVAKVIPRRGRKRPETADTTSGLTLVSFETMTPSTSKHLGHLRSASPFEIVRVPMKYGCGSLYPEDLRDRFISYLESYSNGLSRRDNRDRFLSLWRSRETLLNKACDEWAKPLRDRKFGKYAKIAADMAGYAKRLAEENRAKAARQAAEMKRIFAKFARGGAKNYLSFIRDCFDPEIAGRFTVEQRAKLREKLNGGNSYVWVDGDEVRTSQHIRVPVKAVKAALHAWSLGHDMRKWTVDRYSVVKYEGDVIQIGCHRIPRENILALYEVLMGKPFEMRKLAA